jgi:hypothetical protein
MRLPLKKCAELDDRQKPLYEDMKAGIAKSFTGFTAVDRDGELVGPWNPWISFPQFGGPVWNLVKALANSPKLAKPLREVAILTTGAKFHSAYEIYAHVLVGEARGLSDAKISTLVSGQRPADLTAEEGVVYDVASALVAGPLPALP